MTALGKDAAAILDIGCAKRARGTLSAFEREGLSLSANRKRRCGSDARRIPLRAMTPPIPKQSFSSTMPEITARGFRTFFIRGGIYALA
jgi:hypothetical protein